MGAPRAPCDLRRHDGSGYELPRVQRGLDRLVFFLRFGLDRSTQRSQHGGMIVSEAIFEFLGRHANERIRNQTAQQADGADRNRGAVDRTTRS